ncbi:Hypothetical predicted protein [Mytilus galloprovincialis]|uniref:CCHC-type domain-containing protein n=1 Tax=Mytilus galloprovincialis TaxID=29158 RepID=A0A8B6HFZ4_MYTGA|nr:Hypothetical predicted protein [Mytilus galloprovincialis]
MGRACNYAGQGSAPCTQPAYTGGGQYEMACSKYGTRQTPSHDYGDRQPKNQYNQGYTAVPPQGVTAGVSYGQQAYPVPYNEDRPIENTRGPDNRGGARGTLGGVSKVTNAPENIKYDGKGNWQAFFTKFARKRQEVSYRELVEKLHKRFGFKALPETAQVQFNNARQAPEESLEDWADRVLSLATRAFRNLPDDYMYEQAVMRLCQGIENKQLGVQISNLQPQSIEEAIDKIRLFQHNTQAIYGKPNRREVRQVTDGQYGDHHEAFREYQGPHVRDTMALERAPVSTWKVELEKSDKKFENKLGQVHEKLDDMMDQFKQLLTSPIAGSCLPGRQTGTESCHHCGERGHSKMECPNYGGKSVSGGPSTDRGPPWEGVCYHCLKPGHVKKDCLDLQERNRTVTSTIQSSRTATGPLNLNGTTQEAGEQRRNREPRVSVKVRAEIESEQCFNSDKEATPSGGLDCYLLKCLWNILGHGAPELDHSLLPGGYLLVEEILKRDPGFAGYSLPDIHKLIKVDVDRRFTLIKDSDSGCWKIRANQGYSLMVDTPAIPLVEKCEVPQGNLVTAALLTGDQEGSVANIMRKPIGAILAVENHSSIQKVAATTETTLASDEEAQESWDSTSDGEAHTTLVEGSVMRR